MLNSMPSPRNVKKSIVYRHVGVICFIFFAAFTALAPKQISAQSVNLWQIAHGDVFYFNYLYDGDNLAGYVYVFDQGRTDEYHRKIKFVILDENLKAVWSDTLLRHDYIKFKPKIADIKKCGNKVIITTHYRTKKGINYLRRAASVRTLDLEKFEIGEEYFLLEDEFEPLESSIAALRKKALKNEAFPSATPMVSGGELAYYTTARHNNILTRFSKYSDDLKLIWSYDYNLGKTSSRYEKLERWFPTNKGVFIVLSKIKSDQYLGVMDYRIVYLDKEDGHVISEFNLEKSRLHLHNFGIHYGRNSIYLIGTFAQYEPKLRLQITKNKGFFLMKMDENGKIILDKKIEWNTMKPFLQINASGQMEDKYYVQPLSYDILASGDIIAIAEKRTPVYNSNMTSMRISKSTDLLCFQFDDSFELKKVDQIEKDKTASYQSDLLFTQPINNREGLSFFYQDFRVKEGQKRKHGKWVLGINTIQDRELTTKEIEMSSDKFYIYPFHAKDGYILLREFNLDAKHNSIRLERIIH